MKLNTHSRTPKVKTNKLLIGLFVITGCLMSSSCVLLAIMCLVYARSAMGALFVLIVLLFLGVIIFITVYDFEKAYVEIQEDYIVIVDYVFCIKREKKILIKDIACAEVLPANSFRIRGARIAFSGIKYLVFRSSDDKYLFKIICYPETLEWFEKCRFGPLYD